MNETHHNYTNFVTGVAAPRSLIDAADERYSRYYSGYSSNRDLKPKLEPIDITEDSDFDWAKKICGFDKSKGERLYNVGSIEGEYDLQFVKSKLYKLNMAILGFETVDNFAFCKCMPYQKQKASNTETKYVRDNDIISKEAYITELINSLSQTSQPF